MYEKVGSPMKHASFSWWRLSPLLTFIILAGLFWAGLSLTPAKLPLVQINQKMPAFDLPLLQHSAKSFKSQALAGQVYLLNFWASWCEACSHEQNLLLDLAAHHVVIMGINYKDSPDSARSWLKTWGNPYKAVVQDISGHFAIDLGVYGTPETFLIDAKGIIRARHAGILTAEVWQKELLPLYQKWQTHAT